MRHDQPSWTADAPMSAPMIDPATSGVTFRVTSRATSPIDARASQDRAAR